MQIVLVKRVDATLEGEKAAAVWEFLFEHLGGATEKDEKGWRRFVRALHEAGSGEYFSIKTERRREGWRHRKHMALMTAVFKAQERIEDFEQFRLWSKVGSGFVTWMAGPKGGVYPVPKSISFDSCEEDEFIAFHNGVIDFFRTEHAQHYLWPGASPKAASDGMENILQSFERTPS